MLIGYIFYIFPYFSVFNRLVRLIADHARVTAAGEASLAQARSASEAAKRLINDAQKTGEKGDGAKVSNQSPLKQNDESLLIVILQAFVCFDIIRSIQPNIVKYNDKQTRLTRK